ncbi:MAG: D-methionine transport system substrate-binding protein [Actinomycetota bacterium]|nr:D-methionine transport system substrate-binding protein [Actinomycetota bacterium]
MSDMVRRIAVALILVALTVGPAACSSSAEQTTPTNSTTTSSTAGASTAASTSTGATPSTPAAASSAPTTIPGPQTGWPGPTLRPDGTVPIAPFNAFVDTSRATWRESPLRTSVEFLQLDDTGARTTTLRVTTNPDSLQQAEVIVTADGLLDDSVHATRFEVQLARRSDASWRLTSARWSQKCQPNRGHQDFTPALCV